MSSRRPKINNLIVLNSLKMKNNMFDLNQMKVQELSFEELMHIEGGGFWKTLGIILGIATVTAVAITLISILGPGAAIMAFI
jgi:hypothetical protein